MQTLDFEEILDQILEVDKRYHRDAYYFLREGLDCTQKWVYKNNNNQMRHVNGQELVEGLRRFGIDQFGPMTKTVLNEWGIWSTSDFGEIVFTLIDFSILAKTKADKRVDFDACYDFEVAFVHPFLPPSKRPEPVESACS